MHALSLYNGSESAERVEAWDLFSFRPVYSSSLKVKRRYESSVPLRWFTSEFINNQGCAGWGASVISIIIIFNKWQDSKVRSLHEMGLEHFLKAESCDNASYKRCKLLRHLFLVLYTVVCCALWLGRSNVGPPNYFILATALCGRPCTVPIRGNSVW